MLDDGFKPLLIGTFSNETIQYAHKLYDRAVKDNAYDIRINYVTPVGRAAKHGIVELMNPDVYGNALVEIYNRWLVDAPNIDVVPLSQMMKAVLGIEYDRCPWTSNCGGTFLTIDPDGSVYNCSEFSDMEDPSYKFGNIFDKKEIKDSLFIDFYTNMSQDIFLRFDNGPFEGLKSSGLDIISNDSLRTAINNAYAVKLPLYNHLSNILYEESKPEISKLEYKFLNLIPFLDKDSNKNLQFNLKENDILTEKAIGNGWLGGMTQTIQQRVANRR